MQPIINADDMNIIKKCPLFDGIKEENIEKILLSIQANKCFYQKNSMLVEEDSHINNLGIVLSGGAKAYKSEPSGKTFVMQSLSAGSIFGDVLSISHGNKSPVSVVATADTFVLLLPTEMIIKKAAAEYDYDDRLLRNLLNVVSTKYFELQERINCLIRPTLRDKILFFLNNAAKENNSLTFTIKSNRQSLAEYLNADRSALSRELAKMKGEGLIDYYRNSFKLTPPEQSLKSTQIPL